MKIVPNEILVNCFAEESSRDKASNYSIAKSLAKLVFEKEESDVAVQILDQLRHVQESTPDKYFSEKYPDNQYKVATYRKKLVA